MANGQARVEQVPSTTAYSLTPAGAALNATVSRTRVLGDDAVLKVLASQSMTERRTAAEEVHADHLDTLAGDHARDLAVHAVSEAFAAGRIPASERERRATLALRARTFGELAEATHGLTRAGSA